MEEKTVVLIAMTLIISTFFHPCKGAPPISLHSEEVMKPTVDGCDTSLTHDPSNFMEIDDLKLLHANEDDITKSSEEDHSEETDMDQPLGIIILPNTSQKGGPCSANQRLDPVTDECYMIGSTDPCPPFMEFYKDMENETYGYCDCKRNEGDFRPLVYFKQEDRCFWIYDESPCPDHQWLALDEEKATVACFENPCKATEQHNEEHDNDHYWVLREGECVEVGAKGFCEGDKKPWYNEEANLECMDTKPDASTQLAATRVIAGNIGQLSCSPGHKRSQDGTCSRIASFV